MFAKIKRNISEFMPAVIISLVFTAMLFLYEPLSMIYGNSLDFSYSTEGIKFAALEMFGISLGISTAVFAVIFILSKKLAKGLKPFYICLSVYFVILAAAYIEGVYLSVKLPILDGSKIKWSRYIVWDILMLIISAAITAAVILTVKKVKLKNAARYFADIALVIMLLFGIGLTSSFYKFKNAKATQLIADVPAVNMNDISQKENFIIFLVDAANSKDFYGQIKDDKDFCDFTYCPDTMCYGAYTMISVPQIITGYKMDSFLYQTQYMISLRDSPLIKNLEDADYDINLYCDPLYYEDAEKKRIKNLQAEDKKEFDKQGYFKMQLRYDVFKYAPFCLKRFSDPDTINFFLYKNTFTTDNKWIYERLTENKSFDIKEKNQFKFIHTDGAHAPFLYGEGVKPLPQDKRNYTAAIKCSVTMVKDYLKKLKDNGVYDNTAFIIMADHGYDKKQTDDASSQLEKSNPIFMVKGRNESHDKLEINNKPISYLDLQGIFKDIIQGKKSDELFKDIPDKRTRYYQTSKDKNLSNNEYLEYQTDGKAWEFDKLTRP